MHMSIFLIWIVNVGNIYAGTNRDVHQISNMPICHFRICIYVYQDQKLSFIPRPKLALE